MALVLRVILNCTITLGNYSSKASKFLFYTLLIYLRVPTADGAFEAAEPHLLA